MSTTTESFSFERFDAKGREIGAHIVTFETIEGGRTIYWWRGDATRDGKPFGAGQMERRCATDDERESAITKYLKAAARRAEKNSV